MQRIDYSALEHNVQFYKRLLGNSKLCAVVKNNAYGHGITHVSRYLNGLVDCFAVGSVAEAQQLGSVKNDILILLPQNEQDTELSVSRGYVMTADSFKTLHLINDVSCRLHTQARVHIKIDSGMSRLGFASEEVKILLKSLDKYKNVCVEGVYSHFYGENIESCDKQYSVFLPCAQVLEKAVGKNLIKHIANSSGALLSKKYRLDMARIGLGLYGYGNENLHAVKTVTAKVIAVKNINTGDVVGYGARYVAKSKTRIAVLNVGYANGFCRELIGSFVKINGIFCKVIAICMAMIMVEVNGTNAEIDDEAILLGDGVNISNSCVSVYELLCNLK